MWISDVHLGSKGSKAEALLAVLKKYDPEKLYIVGDFIDGWLLKRRHWWPQSHTNVIRKILSYSKNGTLVYYIAGNHDEFLRSYDHGEWGNIHICDELIHDGVMMVHGDKYDALVTNEKWIAQIGGAGYEIVLQVDRISKRIRKTLGLRPRSFSKWVKSNVKKAFLYIDKFENLIAKDAKRRQCHTVVCGHIHTPADREINGVRYMNTGDWIENLTYIIKVKGEMKLMNATE